MQDDLANALLVMREDALLNAILSLNSTDEGLRFTRILPVISRLSVLKIFQDDVGVQVDADDALVDQFPDFERLRLLKGCYCRRVVHVSVLPDQAMFENFL